MRPPLKHDIITFGTSTTMSFFNNGHRKNTILMRDLIIQKELLDPNLSWTVKMFAGNFGPRGFNTNYKIWPRKKRIINPCRAIQLPKTLSL
jgi:hypothetical protein